MKTVFSTLTKNNVAFFVGVNTTSLKLGRGISSKDNSSMEYFIGVSKNDIDKLPNIVKETFERSGEIKTTPIPFRPEKGTHLLTYLMNDLDINEFKTLQEKFVKVINNKDGRIFELKTLPFKKHVNTLA